MKEKSILKEHIEDDVLTRMPNWFKRLEDGLQKA
jgi:hypothetical protein